MRTHIKHGLRKKTTIDEYHKLEIEEILIRTRASTNQRSQVASLLVTANLAILGFALSTQKAGLVFIAAAFLALWLPADVGARRYLDVLYFRGLQLEKKYAPDSESALLYTLIASTSSERERTERLGAIANLDSQRERIKALRSFHFSAFGILLPAAALLFEVGLGIILWALGWPLF